MSTGGPWQADRGGSLVCKVSLLTAGRNSQGWESQEVYLGPRVRSPPCTTDNALSLLYTHTPDVSVPTNTRTISQTQTPLLVFRWFVPPRQSPAWSCAGCSSSSQTQGCSPVPHQFSVAPAPAARAQTVANSD